MVRAPSLAGASAAGAISNPTPQARLSKTELWIDLLPPLYEKILGVGFGALSEVVVPGIHVGDVRLHHVLDQLCEGDLRHPAELLLRLGAVTLFCFGFIDGGISVPWMVVFRSAIDKHGSKNRRRSLLRFMKVKS